MARIFITGRLAVDPAALISDIDISVFDQDRPPSPAEIIAGAKEAEALVTLVSDRVDEALLNALPSLRVVANHAVGVDNVDVAACTDRGVWVTNTPGVLTESTADLAWALILAVARRVGEGERMVRGGLFSGWAPTMLLGLELNGATLGIVGYGRIGRAVARRAEGFGMQVIHASRHSGVPLEELLGTSDIVSLHCPLTPETRHLIDAQALKRMKPGAILINTARGPVVDEAALSMALDEGRLFGAGLDVYEREPEVYEGLLGRDNVVLLPHLGSATEWTRRRMGEIALENAAAVLRDGRPTNPVNSLG